MCSSVLVLYCLYSPYAFPSVLHPFSICVSAILSLDNAVLQFCLALSPVLLSVNGWPRNQERVFGSRHADASRLSSFCASSARACLRTFPSMLATRIQLLTPAATRRVFARPSLLALSGRRFVASTGPFGSQRTPLYETRRRLLLLAAPLLGASVLVWRHYQREDASVKALLSSERVLPLTQRNYPLSSPAEARRTPFSRLWNLIRKRIFEPILVSGRFLHLLALFLPVIASAPALLFGHVDPDCGERAGALWWYNFLVTQMERAGPTFIKASVLRTGQSS